MIDALSDLINKTTEEAIDTIVQTEDLIKEVIVLPENLIGFKYEDKVDPSDTTPPDVWVKKIN